MSAPHLLDIARQKGVMIAVAESCTGGLLAGALTEVPGSSDVFDRGFVTYSNAAKSELLGVPPALIETHGAVSEEVARAMADGALFNAVAGLAVSITGVAGPGGTETKPEGMVCFGLSDDTHPTISETVQFGPIGRSKVRAASVAKAIALLTERLS
jgi:nicotinamide-nucleotide amidase